MAKRYTDRRNAFLNRNISLASAALVADSTWLIPIIIRKPPAPQSPRRSLRMK